MFSRVQTCELRKGWHQLYCQFWSKVLTSRWKDVLIPSTSQTAFPDFVRLILNTIFWSGRQYFGLQPQWFKCLHQPAILRLRQMWTKGNAYYPCYFTQMSRLVIWSQLNANNFSYWTRQRHRQRIYHCGSSPWRSESSATASSNDIPAVQAYTRERSILRF